MAVVTGGRVVGAVVVVVGDDPPCGAGVGKRVKVLTVLEELPVYKVL